MDRAEARRLAEAVAVRLTVNGGGERASRLVLEGEAGQELGGWCLGAIVDQVERVLLTAAAGEASAPATPGELSRVPPWVRERLMEWHHKPEIVTVFGADASVLTREELLGALKMAVDRQRVAAAQFLRDLQLVGEIRAAGRR